MSARHTINPGHFINAIQQQQSIFVPNKLG
jgi:hypothetical protein